MAYFHCECVGFTVLFARCWVLSYLYGPITVCAELELNERVDGVGWDESRRHLSQSAIVGFGLMSLSVTNPPLAPHRTFRDITPPLR